MQLTSQALSDAAKVINHAGVIAYPTEAVWGLGCDPWCQTAVEKILTLKQRPVHKGLILVAGDWSHLQPLLYELSLPHKQRLQATWPGPYTWLLPDPHDWVPRWIKGDHASVAVRLSSHPLVVGLCRQINAPLVSTSANLAGAPPALDIDQVKVYFRDSLDYVVPGRLGQLTRPTQVRDLMTDKIMRE